MKLHVTFKTPYALSDSAKEKADEIVEEQNQDGKMSEDDEEDLRTETFHKLMSAGRKFIRDGEYVTIEIDTDTGTAKVIPV